jgi:transposase
MWVFRGGTEKNPIILFHYDPGRSGKVPEEYLKDYKGRIQTAGYKGYNLIGSNKDIIHIGCWAHARRKFVEVIETGGYEDKSGLAHEFIELIKNLYKNEKFVNESKYSREEIKKYRENESKPIIEEIYKKLLENVNKVPPKMKLGIAINYALSEWEKLTRYVEDGLIPIDNNQVENVIRPFVIGRKNWLFYDTQAGAEASSFFYSLIETAKANDLEPYSYLNYIFDEIPCCQSEADYEKLLPMFVNRSKIRPYNLPK